MVPQWIIEAKRDGRALSDAELRAFVEGYTRGDIPDYQMAALAMAIYFQGLSEEETVSLTDAMMRSGDLLDTSAIARPKADKHSTGGVGDKVSLILAPLAASCGLAVPMISGRGLGITGGTLDKMESIPGFRVDLPEKDFLDVVGRCGCAIVGQTDRLAPADRKLYALRDVTATVPSIPLITASILSKKLAEGLDALVLDVKWGRGAFMKSPADARALAARLVSVGRRMGARIAAQLTAMNQPLGRAAGNALEVAETIHCLRGNGPPDVMEVTLSLAAQMLLLTGLAGGEAAARTALEQALSSGKALETFGMMIELQGGDPRLLDDASWPEKATRVESFPAARSGYVTKADADGVGRACLVLGAGRRKTSDAVDPLAGISGLVKVGEAVERGQPLAVLHANDAARLAEAKALLADAFDLSDDPPAQADLLGERIDA